MKLAYRIILILIFVAVTIGVISYARGYRLDFDKKAFVPTGIIAVNSYPQNSKVYLNGQFKGATSLNLTLPPGNYTVEVKKDGYTSYSRNINLKGELVLTVDALLFPVNASLSPLTNLGINKAVQVDQTDKIILFSENGDVEKDGIYLFETSKKPLSFLPPLTPVIFKSALPPGVKFSDSNVHFSYDYKQAIFDFGLEDGKIISYLLSLEEQNQEPFDVTLSKNTLLEAWDAERQRETLKILETLPKDLVKIASDSFHIISLSPDENKILYQALSSSNLPFGLRSPLIAANQTPEQRNLEKDAFYVYDKKEDKNYRVPDFNPAISSLIRQREQTQAIIRGRFATPTPSIREVSIVDYIFWYPDSRHFLLKEEKQASIIDYDGTNKQTVYSGPFASEFMGITSDGRILILTNLNPQNNKLPDLYSVGIR